MIRKNILSNGQHQLNTNIYLINATNKETKIQVLLKM